MGNRADMMENHLTPFQSVITEIKSIISSGQEAAYSASSKAMLLTYWNIGKRIVEQELGGNECAGYGRGLISVLAEDLTKEFGKNYSKRNLHYYIKFYQCFPDEQIVNACVHNLIDKLSVMYDGDKDRDALKNSAKRGRNIRDMIKILFVCHGRIYCSE